MKTTNKNWLHDELVALISDETITDDERKLFTDNKDNLEKGQNDRAVASSLKRDLSLSAVSQKLSPAAVAFLSELSQHYIGPTGIGGRDVLFQL